MEFAKQANLFCLRSEETSKLEKMVKYPLWSHRSIKFIGMANFYFWPFWWNACRSFSRFLSNTSLCVCFITVRKYFFLFPFLLSGKTSFTFFFFNNQMEKTICVFTPCSFIQMPRHTNGPLVVCSVWHISSSYQPFSTDNSIFIIFVMYGCFSNCSNCRAPWQCNWRGKFFSSFTPCFVYNNSILTF